MAFAQQLLLDSLSVHMWIISALSKELGIKKMDMCQLNILQCHRSHLSIDWHSSLIYNILSINSLPLQLCLTDSVDSFKMEFLFKQTGLRNVLTALYCLKKRIPLYFIVSCVIFLYWLLLHLIFLFISLFSAVKQFTLFACEKDH